VESLVSLAREAKQRGWWHPYQGAIRPCFTPYIGFETEAAAIKEYASAVDVEQIVKLRRERQTRFQEEDWSYWAVLNEATVRRPVGGADVMRDQLSVYLDDGDEAPYVRMYERLIGMASSPADSVTFLRDARASLP
jgi:hypothetical protein